MTVTFGKRFDGSCQECDRTVALRIETTDNTGAARIQVRCGVCGSVVTCQPGPDAQERIVGDPELYRCPFAARPDEVVCWFPEHDGGIDGWRE